MQNARPQGSCRLSASIGAVFLSLAAAGCIPDGNLASALTPRATVAFDSIDGPPAGLFHKFVQALNDEAEARRVAVVSREDRSQYRVRGYLAAHVSGGRTSIAWTWDVFDAEERRALRIAGEEPGARASKDAWADVDEQMLQRIARTGMDQLTAFLNSPEAVDQAFLPDPAPGEAAVFSLAGNRDSPEAAGISRIPSPAGKT
jgi:hypothetical protein